MLDKKWLNNQFKLDKTDPDVVRRIMALLEASEEPTHLDDKLDEVLEKFSKLARGQMIADPEPEAKWLSGAVQTPGVGQTVRVPPDKFTGQRGQALNGRVGKVVAVRYGDVIFNTTDDLEYIEGLRLRPHELEIKIN